MDEVVWTRRARRNLEEIGDYIVEENAAAAERVIRRIVAKADRLVDHPALGRSGSVPGTRELVITGTPYLVVYRVTHRIEILRIRHGAQRWPG